LEDIFSKESLQCEKAAVALMVRESGGSVRDALSLADQVISFVGDEAVSESRVAEVLGVADRALTRALVTSLASGDARTALESVDAAVGRGVDAVQLARAIVRYVRDLAVLQAAPDAPQLVVGSDEERAELVAQAKQIPGARIAQIFERMVRACDDLGETQMPRMVLELALIDVASMAPMLPLGDLMDRLEGLERKLGPAPRGGGGRPHPNPPPPSRGGSKTAPSPTASPTASPTPSPTPTRNAPADPLAEWEAVITDLEAAGSMTLVMAAQQARILAWTDDALTVSLPEGSMEAAIAADRDSVSNVQKILNKRFGRPIKFEVHTHNGSEPAAHKSLVEVDAERTASQRAARETEAREHPVTKMVLSTFGAEIKEIKTDG
jgi:DNA polymerase-3 subunit gamma/tau